MQQEERPLRRWGIRAGKVAVVVIAGVLTALGALELLDRGGIPTRQQEAEPTPTAPEVVVTAGPHEALWSGIAVPRPAWCPRHGRWETVDVPLYAHDAPACVFRNGVRFLGHWPRLAQCTSTREREKYGVVVSAAGVPDIDVSTACRWQDVDEAAQEYLR